MAMTFTPNNPIIPLRIGIKHDPPTLALVYKRKQQDIKERIYSIVLNGLVELSDPKLVALKLFEEHALVLNENVIDIDQVEKLVSELQKRYEEKKALQQFNNPLTKDIISPIHTYQSANKNPYNIQDNDTDMFLDSTQTNNLQSNHFNQNNNESAHQDLYDSSYHNQNQQSANLATLQTPIQNNNNNNNNSSSVDPYNSQQLSEDAEQYSSGYNPSFSTRAGSASEQKRQKVKNKNEKNKMNLGATHKNLNELIQGGGNENSVQQYINSHYNYGQRRTNNNNMDYLNENNIDNEFIDEQQYYSQNPEYNEDYHNVMNEEVYPYDNNINNNHDDDDDNNNANANYNNQHIQIPESIQSNNSMSNNNYNSNIQNNQNDQQEDLYAYQNVPVKGYIDTQMEYQQNFNNYSDNYGIQYNTNKTNMNNNNTYQNNFNNNNVQYYQGNQNNRNQGSNAPFFSKRQSSSMGSQNYQAYEPQFNQPDKKRRNKFGQLKELANQHRDQIDDQLEVI